MLIVKRHKAFFIPVVIFIITGIIFLLLFTKDEIHLTQNSWHSPLADTFFKYFTHLGDGWIFAFTLPVAMLKAWRYTIGLLIAALLTLFISASLKSTFKEIERPVKHFEGKAKLHLVDGVNNHKYKSFPSGHTMAAFACWGFLALIVTKPKWKIAFALAAILVGYSRIHISQHFLVDVVVGSVLGLLIAYISFYTCSLFKGYWAGKSLQNILSQK